MVELMLVSIMDITDIHCRRRRRCGKEDLNYAKLSTWCLHFIFVKDETGKFEIVNKATAEVYGTTVEDLTGRREAEFVANDEDMERFRSDDLEVIRSGKTRIYPGRTHNRF